MFAVISRDDLITSSPDLQRAQGEARVRLRSAKDGRSPVADLFQKGCLKVRLPRPQSDDEIDVVMINTAGGLTGGDRLSIDVRHHPIFQRVIDTRQAIVVSDTAAEPDWQPHPETDWLHAYACAPIVREGEVIGFLNIYAGERGFFTSAHLQHLQAFADQAALALYNAKLFSAERDQRALAEALQDTATIINSTLDMDVVTDRILDNLKRVLPHDSASLMLVEDGVVKVLNIEQESGKAELTGADNMLKAL